MRTACKYLSSRILALSVAAAVLVATGADSVLAGAIVTRGGTARVGEVAPSGGTIRVTVAQGAATFRADDLAWFTTDATIRTYLAAAVLALSHGAADEVVQTLLRASIENEPDTVAPARRLLARVTGDPGTSSPAGSESIPVIGTITDVRPQIHGGRHADVTVSLDMTDFNGFVDWSPPQYPRSILVPDFSSTSLRTTVLVPVE